MPKRLATRSAWLSEAKKALQMARRAHVTARHLVGIDIFFFDQTIGHAIRSRRIVGADEIALRPIGAVSAAVENEFDMLGDHQAVFLDAGFDFDHRAVARIARDQLFGVVDHQFDRPAGLFASA